MARVICPSSGCQLTLQSWTAPVWWPEPYYTITYQPHYIMGADGYPWKPYGVPEYALPSTQTNI